MDIDNRPKTFADYVKEIRQTLKISQEAMARMLEVSYSTVNRWEKGHCRPHASMMNSITELAIKAGLTEAAWPATSHNAITNQLIIPTMEGTYNISLPETSKVVLQPTVFAEFLLMNISLREYEKQGVVLDMGTGSGVIAIGLAKMGCSRVHAVDLSDSAIMACERNCYVNKVENEVTIIKSDLTNNLRNKYDLVITNPPTLPEDMNKKNNINPIDMAFFSGANGREYIARFIDQLPAILKPSGRFILVYPTYLDRNCLEEMLNHMGFSMKVIAFRHVQLNAYEHVLRKYGYKSKKIMAHMIHKFSKDQHNLIWQEDNAWLFGLEIIEAIRDI